MSRDSDVAPSKYNIFLLDSLPDFNYVVQNSSHTAFPSLLRKMMDMSITKGWKCAISGIKKIIISHCEKTVSSENKAELQCHVSC